MVCKEILICLLDFLSCSLEPVTSSLFLPEFHQNSSQAFNFVNPFFLSIDNDLEFHFTFLVPNTIKNKNDQISLALFARVFHK